MSAAKKNTVDVVLSRISHDAVIPVRVVDDRTQAAKTYRPFQIIDSHSEVDEWTNDPSSLTRTLRDGIEAPALNNHSQANTAADGEASSTTDHLLNDRGGDILVQCEQHNTNASSFVSSHPSSLSASSASLTSLTMQASPPMMTRRAWANLVREQEEFMASHPFQADTLAVDNNDTTNNDNCIHIHHYTSLTGATVAEQRSRGGVIRHSRRPAGIENTSSSQACLPMQAEGTARPLQGVRSDLVQHSRLGKDIDVANTTPPLTTRVVRRQTALPPVPLLSSSLLSTQVTTAAAASLPCSSSSSPSSHSSSHKHVVGVVPLLTHTQPRRPPPRPGWAAAQLSEATPYAFCSRRDLQTRVRYVADDADMHWCAKHGIAVPVLQRGFSMLEWAYLLRVLCVMAVQNKEEAQGMASCLSEMSSWYGEYAKSCGVSAVGASCNSYTRNSGSSDGVVKCSTGGEECMYACSSGSSSDVEGELLRAATRGHDSHAHVTASRAHRPSRRPHPTSSGNDNIAGDKSRNTHCDLGKSGRIHPNSSSSIAAAIASDMGSEHGSNASTMVVPESVLNFVRRVVGQELLDKSSNRRVMTSYLSCSDALCGSTQANESATTEKDTETEGVGSVNNQEVCALCSRPMRMLTVTSNISDASPSCSLAAVTDGTASHSTPQAVSAPKRSCPSSSPHTSFAFSRLSTPLSPRLAAAAKAKAEAIAAASSASRCKDTPAHSFAVSSSSNGSGHSYANDSSPDAIMTARLRERTHTHAHSSSVTPSHVSRHLIKAPALHLSRSSNDSSGINNMNTHTCVAMDGSNKGEYDDTWEASMGVRCSMCGVCAHLYCCGIYDLARMTSFAACSQRRDPCRGATVSWMCDACAVVAAVAMQRSHRQRSSSHDQIQCNSSAVHSLNAQLFPYSPRRSNAAPPRCVMCGQRGGVLFRYRPYQKDDGTGTSATQQSIGAPCARPSSDPPRAGATTMETSLAQHAATTTTKVAKRGDDDAVGVIHAESSSRGGCGDADEVIKSNTEQAKMSVSQCMRRAEVGPTDFTATFAQNRSSKNNTTGSSRSSSASSSPGGAFRESEMLCHAVCALALPELAIRVEPTTTLRVTHEQQRSDVHDEQKCSDTAGQEYRPQRDRENDLVVLARQTVHRPRVVAIRRIVKPKHDLTCAFCHKDGGVCVRCHHPRCYEVVHPSCAVRAHAVDCHARTREGPPSYVSPSSPLAASQELPAIQRTMARTPNSGMHSAPGHTGHVVCDLNNELPRTTRSGTHIHRREEMNEKKAAWSSGTSGITTCGSEHDALHGSRHDARNASRRGVTNHGSSGSGGSSDHPLGSHMYSGGCSSSNTTSNNNVSSSGIHVDCLASLYWTGCTIYCPMHRSLALSSVRQPPALSRWAVNDVLATVDLAGHLNIPTEEMIPSSCSSSLFASTPMARARSTAHGTATTDARTRSELTDKMHSAAAVKRASVRQSCGPPPPPYAHVPSLNGIRKRGRPSSATLQQRRAEREDGERIKSYWCHKREARWHESRRLVHAINSLKTRPIVAAALRLEVIKVAADTVRLAHFISLVPEWQQILLQHVEGEVPLPDGEHCAMLPPPTYAQSKRVAPTSTAPHYSAGSSNACSNNNNGDTCTALSATTAELDTSKAAHATTAGSSTRGLLSSSSCLSSSSSFTSSSSTTAAMTSPLVWRRTGACTRRSHNTTELAARMTALLQQVNTIAALAMRVHSRAEKRARWVELEVQYADTLCSWDAKDPKESQEDERTNQADRTYNK